MLYRYFSPNVASFVMRLLRVTAAGALLAALDFVGIHLPAVLPALNEPVYMGILLALDKLVRNYLRDREVLRDVGDDID